jgi:hypothetical protein
VLNLKKLFKVEFSFFLQFEPIAARGTPAERKGSGWLPPLFFCLSLLLFLPLTVLRKEGGGWKGRWDMSYLAGTDVIWHWFPLAIAAV